jgi:hypothetical protein
LFSGYDGSQAKITDWTCDYDIKRKQSELESLRPPDVVDACEWSKSRAIEFVDELVKCSLGRKESLKTRLQAINCAPTQPPIDGSSSENQGISAFTLSGKEVKGEHHQVNTVKLVEVAEGGHIQPMLLPVEASVCSQLCPRWVTNIPSD